MPCIFLGFLFIRMSNLSFLCLSLLFSVVLYTHVHAGAHTHLHTRTRAHTHTHTHTHTLSMNHLATCYLSAFITLSLSLSLPCLSVVLPLSYNRHESFSSMPSILHHLVISFSFLSQEIMWQENVKDGLWHKPHTYLK